MSHRRDLWYFMHVDLELYLYLFVISHTRWPAVLQRHPPFLLTSLPQQPLRCTVTFVTNPRRMQKLRAHQFWTEPNMRYCELSISWLKRLSKKLSTFWPMYVLPCSIRNIFPSELFTFFFLLMIAILTMFVDNSGLWQGNILLSHTLGTDRYFQLGGVCCAILWGVKVFSNL